MKRLFLFVALITLPFPLAPQNQTDASADDYKVYEAVLDLMDQIPKDDPHVTIFNITLNDKCDAGAPLPLANGCSFLAIKPDTMADVKKVLRTGWKDMEASTWSDFQAKATTSLRLHDPIVTPWKHKLVGPADDPLPEEWQSPDLTLFLSRVGFNKAHTEAIVYVLTFSYMDQVRSGGDYFLFRIDKSGKWTPNGRINYFRTEQHSSP